MPAFLAAVLTREWWKAHGRTVGILAAAILIALLGYLAISAYRGSLQDARKEGAATEVAKGQVRTADAVTKVEAKRAETTAVIADTAVKARKDVEPARKATEARTRRDEAAIASAPVDPMVTAGGPLDRMFGEAK